MNKRDFTWVYIIFFIVVIFIGIKTQGSDAPMQTISSLPEPNTFLYQGCGKLEFAEDTLEQDTYFENDKSNEDLLKVAIMVNGDIIWQSDYINPGEKSKKVVLNEPLEEGEYSVNVIYKIYDNSMSKKYITCSNNRTTLKVEGTY